MGGYCAWYHNGHLVLTETALLNISIWLPEYRLVYLGKLKATLIFWTSSKTIYFENVVEKYPLKCFWNMCRHFNEGSV